MNDERKKANEKDKIRSRKFEYIITNHIGSIDAIKDKFGFKNKSKLSSFRNPESSDQLTSLHLLGLQEYFKIPVDVFDPSIPYDCDTIDAKIEAYQKQLERQTKELKFLESLKNHNLIPPTLYDDDVQTQSQIDTIVKEYKQQYANQASMGIFEKKNDELLKNLLGTWYAYMYPSCLTGIWTEDGISMTKTEIYEDGSVIDEYNNKGILKIGHEQSFIIKESKNAKNLNIIRFNNHHVIYRSTFRILIFSNQNGKRDEEMVNYGFYSRKAYKPDEAKAILGDIDKVQLKLDKEFATRVNES